MFSTREAPTFNMLAKEFLLLVHTYWSALLLAALIIYFLRNKYHNGLNKYPGHPLAAYTDWWRFFDVLGRRTEHTHIQLHRQHGDIVRLGPNVLSFADPRAIKVIYGLNKGMTKSHFYLVQQATAKGERLPSLFSTTSEDFHAKYRRCVNNAFSMSSLKSCEPLVDSAMTAFIEQTRQRYCNTGVRCNFSRWLQFFAFDVIGELTWSKRLGFVERDSDVDGIVEFVSSFLDYAAPVGQLPLMDLLFWKNPISMKLQKWGISKAVFPVTQFALAQSADRAAEMEKIKQDGSLNDDDGKAVDLLMKFTQAQHGKNRKCTMP